MISRRLIFVIFLHFLKYRLRYKNKVVYLHRERYKVTIKYSIIMDFTTTIKISQMIINELTGSAFVHKMQGQLFKSQGFTKLGEKYIGHYTEEMGWVEKYTDRLLDLGYVPEVKVANETKLIDDAKAYIEADLKLQKEGVETLYKLMPSLAYDPTTYDLTKAYLLDEEEDQYWDEEQLDLIEKIGYQNWLVKQL